MLSSKYLKTELKIFFSKLLPQIGNSDTVRYFFCYFLSHFLWTGIKFAVFHSFRKHLFITLLLKRICRDFEIDVAHNFNMCIESPSQPQHFFGFNEQISLIIVSVSILMSESLVTVSVVWLLGRELSLPEIVIWKSH